MSHDPASENQTDSGHQTDFEHTDKDVAVSKDPNSLESASGGGDAPEPRVHRRMPLLIVVGAVILVFDLVTKIIAVANIEPGNPVWLVGDIVSLRLVRNPGAAFSMATGMTWLLTLVAVAVVIAVVRIGRTLHSWWWAFGLGLVLGGALGNLIDRFFRSPGFLQGHVVDFVSIGWWPVFNVADSAIVCGAILLVALTLFGIEPSETRKGEK